MGYGRATSNETLEPHIIEALARKMGLDVSAEEAVVLTTLFLNQLAVIDSFEAFDFQDTVPAVLFSVEGQWDE